MDGKTCVRPTVANLKLVLKAWPMIAVATIGLCFLTQQGAKLIGVELPPQPSLEIVRKHLGFNRVFLLLLAQILVLAPVLEEFLFRYLLFRLPCRLLERQTLVRSFVIPAAILSAGLFSAAHYLLMPWPNDAFLALFFFGLAQCWLYRKTTHLWGPMLNHMLFNLTNLVLLFCLPD